MIFAAFKGKYGGKNYPEAYTKDELEVFGLDDSYRDLYNTRGRRCNAGYNVGVVQPTGVIHPCYNLYKEIGYLYGRVNFQKEMTTCPVEVCACPVFQYDKHLWNKALAENKQPA